MHHVRQAEGVEQGDPLAAAFFALGQHDSLAAPHACLQPAEVLAAFLDDLYVVTCPARAREACDKVSREVEQGAGVSANLGKTRVFHAAGGAAPPGILDLGAEVWRGDKPPAERGFVALGVPIGHEDFVRAQAEERPQAETELLRGSDLQCAWLLLLFCAAPRAQHLLRNVSPALIAGYARAHDDAVWQTPRPCPGCRLGACARGRYVASLSRGSRSDCRGAHCARSLLGVLG